MGGKREAADERDKGCFVCGSDNPIGMKLTFTATEGRYSTTFTPGPEYQSYDGVMHGGLVSTVLDEVMGRYVYAQGFRAVTAKLEVRFRQPTPIGQPVTATAWETGRKRQLWEMAAELRLADGTLTAEGKAIIAIVKEVG